MFIRFKLLDKMEHSVVKSKSTKIMNVLASTFKIKK